LKIDFAGADGRISQSARSQAILAPGPAEAAFDLRSLGDKAKTLHSSRKNWIVEASDVEQTARSEIDSYSDTQIKLI
jgi:hypothetical protein